MQTEMANAIVPFKKCFNDVWHSAVGSFPALRDPALSLQVLKHRMPGQKEYEMERYAGGFQRATT